MLSMAQETELIERAARALAREGLPGTPLNVERLVLNAAANAAGKATPTIAEVVAGVNALVEKLAKSTAAPADPFAGREVVGLCLSPGGEVEKIIRTGANEEQRYAPVRKYWEENAALSSPSEETLAKAQARLRELEAIIADTATDSVTRISAKIELSQVREVIESTAQALRMQKRIGAPPTATVQHYAPTVSPYADHYSPHFTVDEPRLSDTKRVDLEAELAGLRTQVAAPGLTPSEVIRFNK